MKLSECTAINGNLICDSISNVNEKFKNEYPEYIIEFEKNGLRFKLSKELEKEIIIILGYEVNLFYEILTIYIL